MLAKSSLWAAQAALSATRCKWQLPLLVARGQELGTPLLALSGASSTSHRETPNAGLWILRLPELDSIVLSSEK